MVLTRKTDREGLRFLFGAALIAASIYVFYIGTARINSPELFLMPERIGGAGSSCGVVVAGPLSVCIPRGIDVVPQGGGMEIFSSRDRVRGSLEVIQGLPQENRWRASLKNPIIRAFLGDTDKMDTFELMDAILRHRYNPTLMGAKAALIPPWMKRDPQARILYTKDARGIVFYTPKQSLGLSFDGEKVVMMSVMGRIPAAATAGILASARVVTPEEPGTEPAGSS
ncbi:MAG TPA: hypothetical protein PLT09_00995 [Deltaproteobacteria bacterium]|nr:hypothetical protein [Deltaproteobacteria bacterium]HPR53814.1 hypothetical protein [Deltaproteobacteria bacterium]HXK45986.1 hypothetical protein [Deltaproteobacteria bacterium]